MTSDRELDEILAEIGREHRAIGAPERLEPVLFAAVGKRRTSIEKSRMRFRLVLAAAVIMVASAATAWVISQARKAPQPQAQQVRSVPAPRVTPLQPMPATQVAGRQDVRSKSASINSAGRGHVGAGDSSSKQAISNSLDEFVPLPVSEGLSTAGELSVVRVKLRGSDLRQYGLETPADAVARTLQAEFVVGEDGLPRAIRIVR
jgi:hypothetical protein